MGEKAKNNTSQTAMLEIKGFLPGKERPETGLRDKFFIRRRGFLSGVG